ncbi:MAG: leucine-rich repeat protein [Sedimentibacter sp.]
MKKTISVLLVFLMIFTISIPTSTYGAVKDYTGHWAEETIQSWLDNDNITGYPDGSFKPEGKVTRAEFITMVNNLFDYSETSEMDFTDVNSNDWYYQDVQKSFKAGYMAGVSETMFAPNDNLTREQAAVIVSRIMKLEGDDAAADIFTDKSKVSSWALGLVGAAAKAEFIKGYDDNSFEPQNSITRAEAVAILDRVRSQANLSDLTIDEDGTVVENKTVRDLYITKDVGDGQVTLKNVIVTGELLVEGGGENSIVLENCTVYQLKVNKADGKVRILITGDTTVTNTIILSGVTIEQDGLTGAGFERATIDENADQSQTITIKANIGTLTVKAKIKVNVVTGEIEIIIIDITAEGASVDLAEDAKVLLVTIDVEVSFTGTGTIVSATINADGVSFEQEPDNMDLASGISTPDINPSSSGSSGSSGSSSVRVSAISITSANDANIVVNGETLQMSVVITPTNATNKEVTWSVITGTDLATIDATGLLTTTGTGIGTVTIMATNAASRVTGTKDITIISLTAESYFTFDAGTITYYNIEGGLDVAIPSTIGGVAVTGIGDGAFAGRDLTSVIIPDSVETIGVSAFANNQLTSVTIGSSVISIGDNAFIVNSLTSVEIPDSVETIGALAFTANKLTSVTIGSSVISIGKGSFERNALTSVIIPDSVENIGEAVFGGNKLTSVTIGSSVKSIGNYAFVGNSLTSVIIPDNVETIGIQAFGGNKLTSVTIGSSVISIGYYAFVGNSLTSVIIPDSVETIGEFAFSNNQLTSVTIGSSVISIGDYAFLSNLLTTITIGNGVNIGSNLLCYTENSEAFKELYELKGAGQYIGTQDGNWSIVVLIPATEIIVTGANDATSVENGATLQMSAVVAPLDATNQTILWTVDTLAGGTATIDASTGLLTATGAGTVTVTATNTATGVTGTKEITINPLIVAKYLTFDAGTITDYNVEGGLDLVIPSTIDGVPVTRIGDFAFGNKNLKSVIIPDSVVFIGQEAFGNNQLTSVTIGNSVTSIGYSAFGGNYLTSVIIPDSVKTIENWAFAGNRLTSVTIGNSVTSISSYAFESNQITSVIIPDSVKTIGVSAFANNKLTSVTIGSSVTSIGALAFLNNSLTSVIIPDSVETIGESAFEGNQLSSITIGSSVTSIDGGAFDGNYLTSVIIPDSVETIGVSAFANNLLTSVTIPNNIETISYYSFSGNKLASVTIGSSVTSISGYAFSSNLLTSVIIPDSVKTIGESAFQANQLTSVTIGSSVKSIGDYAFGENALTSVIIPDSVETIGGAAFGVNKLTSVTIGSSVTSIGDYAFGENALTSVIIPDSVETIGSQAFLSNLLTTITIGEDVSIGSDLLCNTDNSEAFKEVYALEGAGQYIGTQEGNWSIVVVNPVTEIIVTGAGDATSVENGATLQMSAAVTPVTATNQTILWTVDTLAGGTATIDASTGLLTATGAGTVTVIATNTATGVAGTKEIAVTLVDTDLTAYTTALDMVNEADYTDVSWNVYQTVVLANVVTVDNTQQEVDAATAAITAALADLVLNASFTGAVWEGGGMTSPFPLLKLKLQNVEAASSFNLTKLTYSNGTGNTYTLTGPYLNVPIAEMVDTNAGTYSFDVTNNELSINLTDADYYAIYMLPGSYLDSDIGILDTISAVEGWNMYNGIAAGPVTGQPVTYYSPK